MHEERGNLVPGDGREELQVGVPDGRFQRELVEVSVNAVFDQYPTERVPRAGSAVVHFHFFALLDAGAATCCEEGVDDHVDWNVVVD